MSDNTNSDIRLVRCCTRCLTANTYVLSEQGVGSLPPKVRQIEVWVIENFPRVLLSGPGLDQDKFLKVRSVSLPLQRRNCRIVGKHTLSLNYRFNSSLLCNPGKVIQPLWALVSPFEIRANNSSSWGYCEYSSELRV